MSNNTNKNSIPELYLSEFYYARRKLVEQMLNPNADIESLFKYAGPLLAPMVATCGPAGVNVAPFMLTFVVREHYLSDAITVLEDINKKLWGKGPRVFGEAAKFLLSWIYNIEKTNPLILGSHLMAKGHTYTNIKATGKATVGILIPPDKGALELRTRAVIFEKGPYYEFINLLHDLMHAVPKGERSHEWFPALILEVEEIYDNSYQVLGKRIYP